MICSCVVPTKMCFAADNALVWKKADSFPKLLESDLNMKTNLVIEW